MGAPKGNRFWEARTKHGRDKLFANPAVLWDACMEYFEWVEDNPLHEEKAFGGKDGPSTIDVAKMRAMSIGGLTLFLDIEYQTWSRYRANKDFSEVCTRVEEIIRQQKFTGAAADLLNPAIIARDLGLVDKREIKSANVNITKQITDEMPADKAADVWLEILKSEEIVEQQTTEQIENLSKDDGDLKL